MAFDEFKPPSLNNEKFKLSPTPPTMRFATVKDLFLSEHPQGSWEPKENPGQFKEYSAKFKGEKIAFQNLYNTWAAAYPELAKLEEEKKEQAAASRKRRAVVNAEAKSAKKEEIAPASPPPGPATGPATATATATAPGPSSSVVTAMCIAALRAMADVLEKSGVSQ